MQNMINRQRGNN